MKKHLLISVFSVFLLCFLIVGAAEASPVAYNFSGDINIVNIFDTTSATGSTINTISPTTSTFTGVLTYDTSTPASSVLVGSAYYPGGSFSVTVDGSLSFTADFPEIIIIDDVAGFDRFIINETTSVSSTVVSEYMFLALTDLTKLLYSDTSLPGSLDLADYNGWNGIIISNDSLQGLGTTADSYQLFGNITSLTAVPEPSTLLLLGSGLVGLGFVRRRFKR